MDGRASLLSTSSSCGPSTSSSRRRLHGRKQKRARHMVLSQKQGPGTGAQPWTIGLYHTKRKTHSTGPLGEIQEETYEDVVEPMGWNEDAKLELAVSCVARELEVEEDYIRGRILLLQKLIPDLEPKMKTMKTADIARLAVKVPDVATKLLVMREIFPSANVSLLVSQQPAILLEDMDKIRDRAEQLKGLLETDEIDRAVELNPTFLDLAQVRSAMKEIKRLMPKQNAAKVLLLNPSMLFSMQTGENLIPYDNGTAKQLKASLTGGEDAAPKGW